jgi:hypothetical protein
LTDVPVKEKPVVSVTRSNAAMHLLVISEEVMDFTGIATLVVTFPVQNIVVFILIWFTFQDTIIALAKNISVQP